MAVRIATRAVRLAAVLFFIVLVTAFHHSLGLANHTTVALSLLLVVLAVATLWGLAEAIVASLVAGACFNYFFLPPVGTWTIAEAENWVALVSFLAVSIVASQLSERARRKTREAVAHQQQIARLEEKARLVELARKSEEFKSTVLDALAHELKTPLTSLKASVSALRSSTDLPVAQAELLAIIEEESDRLNRQITEILHMARIDAGKLRLQREPVPVEDLLTRAIAEARPRMGNRTLQVQIGPASVPRVLADADLARTVLLHLLDNAAKYSTPGQPIVLRAETDENQVRIAVIDRGPGIPEAELPHVFERNFRGARSRDSVPGMGIGLAIARDIVAVHGGRIEAESAPGQGTTVSFTLPIATEPRP